MQETFYTLDEIIEGAGQYSEWSMLLNDYPALVAVPLRLINHFNRYYYAQAKWSFMSITDETFFTRSYNRLKNWLLEQAEEYEKKAELSALQTGPSSENIIRYNDTPETSGDYTTVEHTTNITNSKTSNDYGDREKLQVYADWERKMIDAFRRRFLIDPVTVFEWNGGLREDE